MPAKPLSDAEAFELFEQWMERWGFHRLSSEEFRRDARQLKLAVPFPDSEGVGFFHRAKSRGRGLEVRVLTTFLGSRGCTAGREIGWVFIKEGSVIRHASHHPMYRTPDFLHKLFERARAAHLRIRHWPPKVERRKHRARKEESKAGEPHALELFHQ